MDPNQHGAAHPERRTFLRLSMLFTAAGVLGGSLRSKPARADALPKSSANG